MGLQDNWSQVRLAALKATKSMFSCYGITTILSIQMNRRSIPNDNNDNSNNDTISAASLIIPKVCLNRFYVADGIKNYAQDTWQTIVDKQGRNILTTFIDSVIEHYIEMSRCSNHMVSEAACFALSEMVCKLNRDVISPRLSKILDALEGCLTDDSWPVHDAACVSLIDIIPIYFDECVNDNRLNRFLDLWLYHLKSQIWSVRDNAAYAIGSILKSSSSLKMFNIIYAHLNDNFSKVLKNDIKSNIVFMSSEVEKALTQTKINNNITSVLANERAQGELARRRGAWGCCLDCNIIENGGDYECSDGCIYLLRELLQNSKELIAPFDRYLS